MMEFEYSPHRSTGGAMHLLSPTHPQYGVDAFPSIKQIRRSLSRSPSKPSRFHLHTMKSPTHSSTPPQSPSAISRAFSANAVTDSSLKSKFTLRRTAPMKSTPRKVSPNSPMRRVLSEGSNQSNTPMAKLPRRTSAEGQENMVAIEEEATKNLRFELDNEPIKFDLLKAHADQASSLSSAMRDRLTPAKSSPLKRSDGLMNLDQQNLGSPRAKRRSLHGASFGSDFDIFDQGLDGSYRRSSEIERSNSDSATMSASPSMQRSPQRRPFSLRRSTLQQRAGNGTPKPKPTVDMLDICPSPAYNPPSSPAIPRSRSRMSLDSVLPLRGIENVVFPQPLAQKPSQSVPKPHPLSKALSPSSSASSIPDETMGNAPNQQGAPVRPHINFSKSLPIGALRPRLNTNTESSQESSDSFETPEAYRMAKPLPAAFMSTGLISKRNRNVELQTSSLFGSVHMPDTPSKKTSISHVTTTPAPPSGLGKMAHPRHEFGSPTTPFSPHVFKGSPESFGKGVSIFGSRVGQGKLIRRSSFLSIDGDDSSQSPSAQLDSQSANDDLPPTPTKPANAAPRPTSKGGKGNSLRSSLLGRRPSLAPDTFNAPDANSTHDQPPTDSTSPSAPREVHYEPPVTPHESFTPPDASRLSISADHHGSVSLNGTSNSFPPATPTGPRGDYPFNFAASQGFGASVSGYFPNDVDTTLTGRFGTVGIYGNGEFSVVYRVENPLPDGPAAGLQRSRSSVGNVWAVKKSKKPYAGSKDRQRKMREVRILKSLRGHEHIIDTIDTWEMKNHLYIQTEFCENGNLKDFLSQTGFKARLDDFRIWKILLELSLGVKCIHDAGYIHLDLKPANVFIDWEGVLKIGDFGMASSWPAPPNLEGEGDREYIAPEVLCGRFDKPADIFALGMIMLEIAGNIVLPDNGSSWQRLRAGDMSDLPSLTFSSDSSLVRDESGDPINMLLTGPSDDTLCMSDFGDDDLGFLPRRPTIPTRLHDLVQPPHFMADSSDPEALDQVVQWMIRPNPDHRPAIDELLASGGVQWVEQRRRAGATVYEGNWGPADDVLHSAQDVEMLDI